MKKPDNSICVETFPAMPVVAALLLLFSGYSPVIAGSATWKNNPSSGDWNTAANWTPAAVPNGPADTATFATSNTRGVSLSANTEVNGIVFNAGASAFTITANNTLILNITGVGITNNSGITQNFVVGGNNYGFLGFSNNATVGTQTVFTKKSGQGGGILFSSNSSAGGGTFTNEGNGNSIDPILGGGDLQFHSTSTAANGTFTNKGGLASGQIGGTIGFRGHSSAKHATLTNEGGMVSGAGGGTIIFMEQSTAANARLIMKGGANGGAGGSLQFSGAARGGKARVEVYGNGNLDLSVPQGSNRSARTIGSIEGDGQVFLGTLNVGSNNRSTMFSGVFQDGGKYGGTAGVLIKIGTGKLTLTGVSTYTGGTTIDGGTLLVNSKQGSGTGTGFVQLRNGERLGGVGKIAGEVVVNAFLSPGKGGTNPIGTLTIEGDLLLLGSAATYEFELNSSNARADKVIANGVIMNSDPQFSFTDLGSGSTT